ncbi:MAG: helix-turn-helix domain-containing protein [Rubrobacteraceae bacterium]
MRRLRILRAEKGITLRTLAERSGISKDTISEIERGKRRPRASTLMSLAEGLGIDPQVLLAEAAQTPREPPYSDTRPGRSGMLGKFTAVYVRDGEWWVGYVEELTGANAQESTLEECRSALRDATEDVLEANRELTRMEFGGKDVVREPLIA